jgi:hypothetical protein
MFFFKNNQNEENATLQSEGKLTAFNVVQARLLQSGYAVRLPLIYEVPGMKYDKCPAQSK